jgi:hypothetical protein
VPDVATISPTLAVLDDGTTIAAVAHQQGAAELIAVDSTGAITRRADVANVRSFVLAAGSLWVLSATETCSVDQFDPIMLIQGGSVAVPCGDLGPQIIGTADAAWVSDGTALRRIDPASLTLGQPLALPVANPLLLGASKAIFAGADESTTHWFKLDAGGSAFTDLGEVTSPTVAAGDALWTAAIGAERYRAPGSPDVTFGALDFDGVFVAADDTAIYVARQDLQAAHSELWRYPIDHSAPTLALQNDVAVPGLLGSVSLTYVDATLTLGAHHLVATWLIGSTFDQAGTLYVQSFSLP